MVINGSTHYFIFYVQKKDKRQRKEKYGEGDNPFFNLGGMGTGANADFDACVALGEHELK